MKLTVADDFVASDDKQLLEKDILAYLAKHPHARDTLDGIVQWWLLEQRIERTTAEVRAALAGLVARKLVKEVRRSDGHVYFCLPKEDSV